MIEKGKNDECLQTIIKQLTMKLNDSSLLYLSLATGPGVKRKIEGFCKAAKKAGFQVEYVLESGNAYVAEKRLIRRMLDSDAKYIVVRSFTYGNVFFLKEFVKARHQGRILIIDVPTPMNAYLREVEFKKKPLLWKLSKKTLTYVGGPLGLLPFHRVIQYGDESKWFSLFSKRKTKLIGNGIDTSRLPLRSKDYLKITDKLVLIAVAANIISWHGFDRVVKAMVKWKEQGNEKPIEFHLIGGDDSFNAEEIRQLAKKGGIEDSVIFHGLHDSDYIIDMYGKAHIAVSSLGLFREKLFTASVLKSREYCLAGIPFIASAKDPDFSIDLPFRFEVSNDDDIRDIVRVFELYEKKRSNISDEEIRQYAMENLSFDAKFMDIIEGL